MNRKKITIITACLIMALSLTACGNQPPQSTQNSQSSQTAQDTQPADSGSATEQELLDEENKILSENQELWEKVFGAMDKNVTDSDLSKNYGDFLLDAIESAKEQFTDEEYEILRAGAEKIRDIENRMAQLPQDDSAPDTASANAFPQFDGYDLDGNKVDSSLFSNNEFTVVNFWFSGCKPCVAELGELDKLNKSVSEQGGEVIGINVETFDGNEQNIETAKQILEAKGASYRNIYFDSASDAGKFSLGIMAFPTTYVIDKNGNIVGEPLLGGIDSEENLNKLLDTISKAGSEN